MATIGTFTSNGNGFTGTVRTLALNAKANLVRVETPSDKGPHFRIFAGNVELGAAWQKTAKDTERYYLSVKLDDPSFPAPIYASLRSKARRASSSSGPGRTEIDGSDISAPPQGGAVWPLFSSPVDEAVMPQAYVVPMNYVRGEQRRSLWLRMT